MKKFLIFSSIIPLMGTLSWAAPTERNACSDIKTACQEAGFVAGQTAVKGKRLYKDCIIPLMDGKTVPGVTVTSSAIEQCRARGRQAK